MTLTEDAARNELAAIRLFLRLPDGESIIGHLRRMFPLPEVPPGLPNDRCEAVAGCARKRSHPGFHCTSPQIAAKEDARV